MKYYKIYLFGLLSVFLFAGCFKDQEELFDKPSDERVGIYISQFEEILLNSSYGWIMDYFPNSISEGYSLLMDFNNDKSVKIAGMNKWSDYKYVSDISLWDVIRDDNPVLTFNTYNEVFHLFSNPQDPDGTSSLNGIGLQGDYEFNIVSFSEDKITLKGKKQGATIILTKLNVEDWQGFLTERVKMEELLFSQFVSQLSFNYNSEQIYTLINPFTKYFNLDNQVSVPFIVTESGIRLHSALDFEGSKLMTFNLSEDKRMLVCDENNSFTITGENELDFFMNMDNWTGRVWRIDEYAGTFKEMYDNVVSQCEEIYSEQFNFFSFRFSGERLGTSLYFGSGEYRGNVDIDVTVDDNGIKVLDKGSGDMNGMAYMDKLSSFKDFVNSLCSTSFEVKSISGLNPTVIYMYDLSDKDNYIKVVLTEL